jgi:hypothetical protein
MVDRVHGTQMMLKEYFKYLEIEDDKRKVNAFLKQSLEQAFLKKNCLFFPPFQYFLFLLLMVGRVKGSLKQNLKDQFHSL